MNLPAERRPLLRLERQRLEAELYRVLPSLLIEPVSTQKVASALKAVAADGFLVEFQEFRTYSTYQQGKAQWGDARYMALLLKPDGSIASVALGEAAVIDAAVSAALLETVRNELDPAPLWAQVSRLVLGPLQSHLVSGQQLFISPDGELHRVPFAALPSLRDPQRRLGDDLRLSVLTSGRDLLRLQKPAGAGGPSVLMANPRYDAIGRSTAPTPSERAGGERRGLQQRTGELTSGTILKPLPATEEEARLLLVPITTLARAMRRLGLNRLRNLDPKPPVQRYKWEQPGDMIHVDIKQLARLQRVGHRITGDPRKGSSPGAGYEKVHVAVDDATPLSYVEVLPDEKGPTTVGFLSRAVAWFNGQGIECQRVLSDNGSAYKSHGWQSRPGHGIEGEEDQALHPKDQRQDRAFWLPADFVYIKTLLEEWA